MTVSECRRVFVCVCVEVPARGFVHAQRVRGGVSCPCLRGWEKGCTWTRTQALGREQEKQNSNVSEHTLTFPRPFHHRMELLKRLLRILRHILANTAIVRGCIFVYGNSRASSGALLPKTQPSAIRQIPAVLSRCLRQLFSTKTTPQCQTSKQPLTN